MSPNNRTYAWHCVPVSMHATKCFFSTSASFLILSSLLFSVVLFDGFFVCSALSVCVVVVVDLFRTLSVPPRWNAGNCFFRRPCSSAQMGVQTRIMLEGEQQYFALFTRLGSFFIFYLQKKILLLFSTVFCYFHLNLLQHFAYFQPFATIMTTSTMLIVMGRNGSKISASFF